MDVTQSQPMTAAERQAAHRERKRREYATRLNLYIPEAAGSALRRLARHHGITQGEVIARLVTEADAAAVAGLPDDALDGYYGVTR